MIFEELIKNFLYFGFFLSGLISSSTIFLPLPIYFLIVLSQKFGLNPIAAAVSAAIGTTLGELTSYFVGYGISSYVFKNPEKNKRYKIAKEIFKKYGLFGIFIFSITPLPFDAIGILCGTFRYDIKKFLVITFLGKLVKMLLVVFIGEKIIDYLGW